MAGGQGRGLPRGRAGVGGAGPRAADRGRRGLWVAEARDRVGTRLVLRVRGAGLWAREAAGGDMRVDWRRP